MTDPYREKGEIPAEVDSVSTQRIALGPRVSSHPRRGLTRAVGTVLGNQSAVDVHSNGLVLWSLLGQRSEVLFTEIDAIHYRFQYGLDEAVNEVLPDVIVKTFEGKTFEIQSSVVDLESVVRAIELDVTPPITERALDALARGDKLFFGPLTLELDGIRLDDSLIPWRSVPRVIARQNVLAIHGPDTKGLIAEVLIESIPHPRVLLALLARRVRVVVQNELRLIAVNSE